MVELCCYATPIAMGIASKSLDLHRVFQHPLANSVIVRMIDWREATMLNLKKGSTISKFIFRIALYILVEGLPNALQCENSLSAASDWAIVSKALDDAQSLYKRDCPTDAACSPATSELHKARVSAFEHARDLMTKYGANWVKDPTSKEAVRLD